MKNNMRAAIAVILIATALTGCGTIKPPAIDTTVTTVPVTPVLEKGKTYGVVLSEDCTAQFVIDGKEKGVTAKELTIVKLSESHMLRPLSHVLGNRDVTTETNLLVYCKYLRKCGGSRNRWSVFTCTYI